VNRGRLLGVLHVVGPSSDDPDRYQSPTISRLHVGDLDSPPISVHLVFARLPPPEISRWAWNVSECEAAIGQQNDRNGSSSQHSRFQNSSLLIRLT
jgi:hypothetical protein